jgi:hypothetical protein
VLEFFAIKPDQFQGAGPAGQAGLEYCGPSFPSKRVENIGREFFNCIAIKASSGSFQANQEFCQQILSLSHLLHASQLGDNVGIDIVDKARFAIFDEIGRSFNSLSQCRRNRAGILSAELQIVEKNQISKSMRAKSYEALVPRRGSE